MDNCTVLLWNLTNSLSSVPEMVTLVVLGKNDLDQSEFTFEKNCWQISGIILDLNQFNWNWNLVLLVM